MQAKRKLTALLLSLCSIVDRRVIYSFRKIDTVYVIWPGNFLFENSSAFLYLENHSLGEWFQKRLLPKDVQRKTPFARIGVRSGNCTKKQREAIRDE